MSVAARVVEAIDVDSVLRELGPCVVATLEHLKKRLDVLAITRKAAGHTDYGDRHDLIWLKILFGGHLAHREEEGKDEFGEGRRDGAKPPERWKVEEQ